MEESLRYDSQSGWVGRITTEPLEAGGQRLPAGSLVFGLTGSANRDEREYQDPDRFDIGRTPVPRHLTFGYGAHACLGAALARLETRVCLERLLHHLPAPALATPGEPEWIEGIALRGLTTLPLRPGPGRRPWISSTAQAVRPEAHPERARGTARPATTTRRTRNNLSRHVQRSA